MVTLAGSGRAARYSALHRVVDVDKTAPAPANERHIRRPFRLLADKQTVLSPMFKSAVPVTDLSLAAEVPIRRLSAGRAASRGPRTRLDLAPKDELPHNSAVAAANIARKKQILAPLVERMLAN